MVFDMPINQLERVTVEGETEREWECEKEAVAETEKSAFEKVDWPFGPESLTLSGQFKLMNQTKNS